MQLLVLLAVLVPVVVAYALGFGRRAALARSILVSDCDPQRYRAFVTCVLQLDAKLMSRQVVPVELAMCDLFAGEYVRLGAYPGHARAIERIRREARGLSRG